MTWLLAASLAWVSSQKVHKLKSVMFRFPDVPCYKHGVHTNTNTNMNKMYECHVKTGNNDQSTSSICTLSVSLSNTGVITLTWTVIRLSNATLLYATTLPELGVSNSTPNGCLSQLRAWRASIHLSLCARVKGGWRDVAS